MSEAVHKLDELAGQVNDVRVMVARMEGKLDALVTGHADHETRIRAVEQRPTTDPADHETRLRRLERAMWVATGAGVLGGGGLGALASTFLHS